MIPSGSIRGSTPMLFDGAVPARLRPALLLVLFVLAVVSCRELVSVTNAEVFLTGPEHGLSWSE